jgi:hypothetical protein
MTTDFDHLSDSERADLDTQLAANARPSGCQGGGALGFDPGV